MRHLSFRDTRVVFATNHQKAQAAREYFARILNTIVEEVTIESDCLGTFSGEVERAGTMLDALRSKVRLAREITKERLVLVSEGSFSTTSSAGFLAQNIEMLMLYDGLTGVEVVEQYVSLDTNYSIAVLSSTEDLARFLKQISFGSHGLVLYPKGLSPKQLVYKGITSLFEAERAFGLCVQASPESRVMAMSDMRAHRNPSRMRAIGACSELLASRLATLCPSCQSGGFGLVGTIPGLPCEWCGAPTRRARIERHACVVCDAHIEKPRSDGLMSADPSECDRCNP